MSYGWIITKDHLEPGPFRTFIGPHGLAQGLTDRLHAGEGVEFRMRDDDGILYYEGRFIGDADSEDAFAPLDDFGTPNAGCTSIEYRGDDGEWRAL